MIKLIIRWIIFALSIWLTAYLLEGIQVDNFVGSLFAALGLGIINATLGLLLRVLTLPLNFLTLGLFSFVINALIVLLAAEWISGFSVDGFWWALLFSLVVSVINGLLSSIIKDTK